MSENFIKKVENTLIWLGAIVVLFLYPKGTGHDGKFRFYSMEKLMESGVLDEAKYSITQSIFAVPLYLLGYLHRDPHWWISRFNAVLFVVALIIFYNFFKTRLPRPLVRKFLILLIAGSMFPKHIKQFYSEPFGSLFTAMGIVALCIGYQARGFFMMIFAAINAPATLVGTGLAALCRSLQTFKLRYLLIPILAGAGFLLESWLRRQGASGYEGDAHQGVYKHLIYAAGPGFAYPFFFGVLSVFLSFGKGLIFFTPGVFFPIKRFKSQLPPEIWSAYIMWLCYLAGLILVYCRWFSWWGGLFWGPRFYLFACIPAAFALALYVQNQGRSIFINFCLLFALFLSIWGGLNGVIIDQSNMHGLSGDLESYMWYIPEYSVLWRPFVKWPDHLKTNDYSIAVYFVLVFIYFAHYPVKELIRQIPDYCRRQFSLFYSKASWKF